jgi:hypothetical protein
MSAYKDAAKTSVIEIAAKIRADNISETILPLLRIVIKWPPTVLYLSAISRSIFR